MDGNGGVQQINVPIIELGGVTVSIARNPNDPTQRIVLIGPVMLSIPLDEDSRKVVVRGLTGIEIAGRMDVPKE